MTAYRLAFRMRTGLDGRRLSFRRSLMYARAGIAAWTVLAQVEGVS